MKNKMSAIKFEIPDGTPEQQIKMIQDLMDVMSSTAEMTGEKVDLTPFEDIIKEVLVAECRMCDEGVGVNYEM